MRQPVDTIAWVDPATLHANNYNPNHVHPPELALLKESMVVDGWTGAIVALPDGEIVDGFHRWLLATKDEEVLALGNGKVPVVRIKQRSRADQMAATVRHNRARGEHQILRMADIVVACLEEGWSWKKIGQQFGMESEEIERLSAAGGMVERGSAEDFGEGWTPDTSK